METLFGWLLAGCIIAVVIAFFVAILIIAFSPLLGIAYLIADWCERRRLKRLSPDVQRALQVETEVSSKECSKVHCN
jgi:Flp pilus assembly protein TadB